MISTLLEAQLEKSKKNQEGELLESSVPQNSKQNLESKIESLIRSIENLSEKKVRIEFELKRQKRSLARKREELKRVSHSIRTKVGIRLESASTPTTEQISVDDQKRIQLLLQESARILEE